MRDRGRELSSSLVILAAMPLPRGTMQRHKQEMKTKPPQIIAISPYVILGRRPRILGLLKNSPSRHFAQSVALRLRAAQAPSQNPFTQVALMWILRFGAAVRSMTEYFNSPEKRGSFPLRAFGLWPKAQDRGLI
jgi:hypothetical protein